MIRLPLFHAEPGNTPQAGHSADNDRPYFLFVGRLEKIKGAQTLIPVFRQLLDVDLVIAGTGTFERQLKRMADGSPNIRFIGRANAQQLHRLYQNAVATIVPSLCYETFGIIVAESFAARTPVIVRNGSSLREFVEEYGGGFTFDTKDQLRSAIDKLRNDGELRDRLGLQGRAAYDAEFSETSFLAHYLTAVGQLLAIRQVPSLLGADA